MDDAEFSEWERKQAFMASLAESGSFNAFSIYCDAPEDLKADREVLLVALVAAGIRAGYVLHKASEEHKADRDVVLVAVKLQGNALYHASEVLQDDKEVVLVSVAQSGISLRYASDRLRADPQVVLRAIRFDPGQDGGDCLRLACENLQNNRDFLLRAVTVNGFAVRWTSDALRADPEIVFAAVRQNGNALEFVAEEMRGDRDVVLAALGSNGRCLRLAAEAMRSDREVVMAAVRADGLSLEYADEAMKADQEVVLAATESDWRAFQLASEALQSDWEVLLVAIRSDWHVFDNQSDALKSDRDFILRAITQNLDVLQCVAPAFKGDRGFIRDLIKIAPIHALTFATGPVKVDPEVLVPAMAQQPLHAADLLEAAPPFVKSDRVVVIAASRHDSRALKYAAKFLKKDRDVTVRCVEGTPASVEHADEAFRKDRGVIEVAITKDPSALKFALGGLADDRALLAKIGLEPGQEIPTRARCLIVCTKYGLAEDVGPFGTMFTEILQTNKVIRSKFSLHNPAITCKSFCGTMDRLLDQTWECLGECGMMCKWPQACNRNPQCKDSAEPTSHSCWRYAFRWYLQKAIACDGALVQICERTYDTEFDYWTGVTELSPTQQIVQMIAESLGIKVFRSEMPDKWGTGGKKRVEQRVDQLAADVLTWTPMPT